MKKLVSANMLNIFIIIMSVIVLYTHSSLYEHCGKITQYFSKGDRYIVSLKTEDGNIINNVPATKLDIETIEYPMCTPAGDKVFTIFTIGWIILGVILLLTTIFYNINDMDNMKDTKVVEMRLGANMVFFILTLLTLVFFKLGDEHEVRRCGTALASEYITTLKTYNTKILLDDNTFELKKFTTPYTKNERICYYTTNSSIFTGVMNILFGLFVIMSVFIFLIACILNFENGE